MYEVYDNSDKINRQCCNLGKDNVLLKYNSCDANSPCLASFNNRWKYYGQVSASASNPCSCTAGSPR